MHKNLLNLPAFYGPANYPTGVALPILLRKGPTPKPIPKISKKFSGCLGKGQIKKPGLFMKPGFV